MKHHVYFCVILFVSTLVHGEPPVNNGGKSIVSQRLLNRVADIIANGGDGSSRDAQSNEGNSIVDKELLDRIARIISQNDGQLSWSQKSQKSDLLGQPSTDLSLPNNENDQQYGIPPSEVPANAKELAGAQLELSPPEPVPRIAAFDFSDDDDNTGYSSPLQTSSDSYADNRNFYQHNNGRPQLGDPESAVRIASFDIQGEQPPAPYTPPQARGGYHNR